MWKRCASQFARKRSLYARNLVLYVLRLLTKRSSRAIWADTLDGIADALDVPYEPVRDNRKIRREEAVVIDQKNIWKVFCNVATDELRNDL